jgi:hypothetical protein
MTTRAYNPHVSPWPLRLLAWLFRGLLMLTIMAAAGVAVVAIASSAFYELTRTKAGDIEGMIDKKVPVGSSVEHINSVLDQEGFEHTAVQPFPANDLDLLYAGVREGDPVILATVENEGYSLELVDVKVAFVLDENGVLKHAVVYEDHHQPEWLNRNLDALK